MIEVPAHIVPYLNKPVRRLLLIRRPLEALQWIKNKKYLAHCAIICVMDDKYILMNNGYCNGLHLFDTELMPDGRWMDIKYKTHYTEVASYEVINGATLLAIAERFRQMLDSKEKPFKWDHNCQHMTVDIIKTFCKHDEKDKRLHVPVGFEYIKAIVNE